MRMCHGFSAKPKLLDAFWYANLKKTSKTFKKILKMWPGMTLAILVFTLI